MNKLDLIQETAYQNWIQHNSIGTIEMATGTGKGFIAIKAILSRPKGSDILYLFETKTRRNTILNEISKYEKLNNVKVTNNYNITLTTYQTAYKWVNKKFDLVIGD